MMRTFLIFTLLLFTAYTQAGKPSVGSELPKLSVSDKGEILLSGDKFSYQAWHSAAKPGEVHVLQYFAGTKSASKIFEPFTDQLQVELPDRGYHVTTIINLDAAMWGTGGFVVSEAKASKKKYPLSTLVLDEQGNGVDAWELGETGALLVVMDKRGSVIFVSHAALTEDDMAATLALIKEQMKS